MKEVGGVAAFWSAFVRTSCGRARAHTGHGDCVHGDDTPTSNRNSRPCEENPGVRPGRRWGATRAPLGHRLLGRTSGGRAGVSLAPPLRRGLGTTGATLAGARRGRTSDASRDPLWGGGHGVGLSDAGHAPLRGRLLRRPRGANGNGRSTVRALAVSASAPPRKQNPNGLADDAPRGNARPLRRLIRGRFPFYKGRRGHLHVKHRKGET